MHSPAVPLLFNLSVPSPSFGNVTQLKLEASSLTFFFLAISTLYNMQIACRQTPLTDVAVGVGPLFLELEASVANYKTVSKVLNIAGAVISKEEWIWKCLVAREPIGCLAGSLKLEIV